MAIRFIVKDGDPVLRKKSKPVEIFDEKLGTLLDDMAQTLRDADGCGLAAPQVGILKRAVIVDVGEGAIELINPKIIAKSGVQEEMEGCLSCPGLYGTTRRPMNVTVRAQDRNGKEFSIKGSGLLARALCHEIDHLDGILFKDHAKNLMQE